MRTSILLIAVLALGAPLRGQVAVRPDKSMGCLVCHGEEAQQHARGMHARAGLGCVDCHGGDATAVEVEEAHGNELKSLASPADQVASCGGCHADVQRMRLYGLRTDQLSLYWTSQHGILLAKDPTADVATCVSCHGSHEVLPPGDTRAPCHKFNQIETCGRCHADPARMDRHGLGHDVIEKYRSSVHGRALLDEGHPAAPACTDCHGSHGAAPPRVREIETVCGRCHSVVQDFFEQSPHAPSAAGGATVQCVSCHENHAISTPTRQMFLGDAEGHCGSCHTADVGTALTVGEHLYQDVDQLENRILDAEASVRDASRRGLFLGAESGFLSDARSLLVRARALTHTLSIDVLDDVLNRGEASVNTAMESLDMKERGLRDRKIFTGLFFAVALAFSIALLLYAREIRGRWKEGRADGTLERPDGI